MAAVAGGGEEREGRWRPATTSFRGLRDVISTSSLSISTVGFFPFVCYFKTKTANIIETEVFGICVWS